MIRCAVCLLALTGSTVLAQNWPSFRGPSASGVADGQNIPLKWDPVTGIGIAWKTPIPGLAHSSPIVWGDRVFVTTSVSSRSDATFKPGLYGAGTASEDTSPQRMMILCLDRRSGKILWERTAYEGVPKEKRHIKSTYANATPATDGTVVVALFGSHGLYAYNFDGKLLWKQDLGRLNVGAYDLPEYEWGTASSPILYRAAAIVQCDQQKGSFIAAFDRSTGRPLWRTERDELPSWGTPTVVPAAKGAELVTNGSNRIRAYDPANGKELWQLAGSSKITAPTPIFAGDLIIVGSGRGPEAPIFAVHTGGRGEIAAMWRKEKRGPYMPTPLILGEQLYVLGNAGIFDSYDLKTGADIYRQRIPHQGSGFSGSPVAADGRVYLPSEDGDVFVVRAGRSFELLGRNAMGEPLMATPAISRGLLLVRTQHHLWAIGSPGR